MWMPENRRWSKRSIGSRLRRSVIPTTMRSGRCAAMTASKSSMVPNAGTPQISLGVATGAVAAL